MASRNREQPKVIEPRVWAKAILDGMPEGLPLDPGQVGRLIERVGLGDGCRT